MRALGVVAAVALGAFAVLIVSAYAMTAWQRAEVDAAKNELADLQARIAPLAAKIADMREAGSKLDAKGVRFITDSCIDKAGKRRLCVEIDAQAGAFESADHTRELRIPKGF